MRAGPDRGPAAVDEAIARALASSTRYAILERIVAADGPLTVADLAAGSGLHHTTVRAHLAVLEAAGLVGSAVEERTTRGRPRVLVEPTPRAITALGDPGPYERLAVMLATVTRTASTPYDVGRASGREQAARHAGPVGVEDLVLEFRRLGFAPDLERHAGGAVIRLTSCPFAHAAEEDAATVCAIHEGWAVGFLDGVSDVEVEGLQVEPPRRAGCSLRLREAADR